MPPTPADKNHLESEYNEQGLLVRETWYSGSAGGAPQGVAEETLYRYDFQNRLLSAITTIYAPTGVPIQTFVVTYQHRRLPNNHRIVITFNAGLQTP